MQRCFYVKGLNLLDSKRMWQIFIGLGGCGINPPIPWLIAKSLWTMLLHRVGFESKPNPKKFNGQMLPLPFISQTCLYSPINKMLEFFRHTPYEGIAWTWKSTNILLQLRLPHKKVCCKSKN
jgi:hypothetical protein